jgi:peroxiredoxin
VNRGRVAASQISYRMQTMTRRSLALLFCVAAFVALGASTALAVNQGALAPEIGLKDRSGKAVQLSQLRGSVVIVDFWASWCAPCRDELPVLEALYQKYRGKGLVVVGVGQDADAAKMAKFLRATELSFPVVHDAEGAVARRYAPPKMPTSYIVDRQGLIRHVHAGFRASDKDALERELKALLEAK